MPDIYNMSDVFISYSRRDSDFTRRVFDHLKAQGKEVWADFEDIPKTADWWAEIQAGIDAADSFVFIISPDSVRSDICRDEIDHAVAKNKRFIPVLFREITEEDDKAKIHPSVSSHNWIFARENDDYDAFLSTLMESIETDLTHNRMMTRLLVRAQEWQSKDRNHSYLLQGNDLDDADAWLQAAVGKTPAPSDLHSEYIGASRKAKSIRQRRLTITLSVALVLALILSVFAVFQALDARQARDVAENARNAAQDAATRAKSLALASSASGALFNNDPDLALALSWQAVQLDGTQPQVFSAVADSVYSNGTKQLLDVDNTFLFSVALSQGGKFIAHGSDDGRLCLHDIATDTEIKCFIGHESRITNIELTTDETRMISSSSRGRLIWWDIDPESDTYGEAIAIYQHTDEDGNSIFIDSIAIQQVEDNPWRVFFGTGIGELGIWVPETDQPVIFWESPHQSAVQALVINSDGTRLLSGDQNGLLVHWYLRYESYFDVIETEQSIAALDFNGGGQSALIGYFSEIIEIIDLVTGEVLGSYIGHEEPIRDLEFGERDETFISVSWDRSIIEWDVISGRIIRSFYGHSGGINDLAIDLESQTMVTASYDTDVRVWSLDSFNDRKLTNNQGIWHLELSPNKEYLITSHDNGDVIIWTQPEYEVLYNFRGYNEPAIWASMGPNNKYLVTLFDDHLLTMRDVDTGKRLWVTELRDKNNTRTRPYQVHFTHDGARVVVVLPTVLYIADTETGEMLDEWVFEDGRLLSALIMDNDEEIMLGFNRSTNNLVLYNLNTGEEIRRFIGHSDGVVTIDKSLDGTMIASGGYDNIVRAWDFETGNPIRAFNGHSTSINDVAFDDTGESIVSVSNDRSVRLWSMESGFELFRYSGHAERVNAVVYTADYSKFITGSMDNTFLVWSLPKTLEDLTAWVKDNRYLRDLSCSEQVLYLDSDCDPLVEDYGQTDTATQETSAEATDEPSAETTDEPSAEATDEPSAEATGEADR